LLVVDLPAEPLADAARNRPAAGARFAAHRDCYPRRGGRPRPSFTAVAVQGGREGIGHGSQGSGVRGQESGVRSQESGVRGQRSSRYSFRANSHIPRAVKPTVAPSRTIQAVDGLTGTNSEDVSVGTFSLSAAE